MKKALCFAMAVIAAISLILVSPLVTDTTTRVQWQTTDIDAPGGG
jgi:hypothetical protein